MRALRIRGAAWIALAACVLLLTSGTAAQTGHAPITPQAPGAVAGADQLSTPVANGTGNGTDGKQRETIAQVRRISALLR